MTTGIYSITAPSGKRYIGQSINCEKRFVSHLWNLRNNRHCNSTLQKAYLKYGDTLSFKVLASAPKEHLDELEQLAIDMLVGDVYNQSPVLKQGFMDPGLRDKLKKAQAEVRNRPGWADAASRRASEVNNRPGMRERRAEQARTAYSDPTTKAKYSEGLKKAWTSPLRKEAHLKARENLRLQRMDTARTQHGLLLYTTEGLKTIRRLADRRAREGGSRTLQERVATRLIQDLITQGDIQHTLLKNKRDISMLRHGLLLLTKKGLQVIDSEYQKLLRNKQLPTERHRAGMAELCRIRREEQNARRFS